MPPLPPPPPLPAAADQAAVLEQVQKLEETAPALAFVKAAQLNDPLLRDRVRRDAFVALARSNPREAAAVLPDVIEARWLPAVHFLQALDIAEHSIRTHPEATKKLLLTSAVTHPAAALREVRQYIELPYGPAIREAAMHASRDPDPELALLRYRQNPSQSPSAAEAIRLASHARTEEERDTARKLLRRIEWVPAAPAALRAALALLAETGAPLAAPAAIIQSAFTGIEEAGDPIAEAAKAAVILSAAPASVADALPDSRLGSLLRSYRQSAPQATLPTAALFPDGVCLQRHIFHDDEDGAESFQSFLDSYSGDPDWKIQRTAAYVHLTSRAVNGRRIGIYANIPSAGQHAVNQLRLHPTVIVHRGHDHHFPATRKLLLPSARLVFLGSCNGVSNVEDVVTRCPRAQLIATRGVGTTAVNDVFLRALNRQLLSGAQVIDWDNLWAVLRPVLAGNEHFPAYIPPHKNEAARFLAAWYKAALAAP